MPVMPGNWNHLLEPIVKEIFDLVANRPDPMRDILYRVESSDRAIDRRIGMGSRRLVPVFDGRISYEDQDAGFRSSIRNYLLTDGLSVARTLMEDDQFGTINDRITDFSANYSDTREHDAVQTFVNAFTDSGTNRLGESTNGGDAVALCSLVHPDSPVNTGSTQANEGTLALSIANADTTRQLMLNWTDDKGKLQGIRPDTVLVPTELQRQALQIFPQSERNIYEPGSAQFDTNLFGRDQGGDPMKVLTWNRLTDSNAWFMIDSTQMKRHLIWQDRVPPMVETNIQTNPELAQWTGRTRYGSGFRHWAWVFGQNPS